MPSKKKTSKSVNWSTKKLDWKLVLIILLFAVGGTWLLARSYAAPSKGGGGGKPSQGSGTISLQLPPAIDNNSDGQPNWSDQVSFSVATTSTTQPWVNLKCVQGGKLVSEGWKGYFVGSLDTTRNFNLSSPSWVSGAADCTAFLDMYTSKGYQQLTSTSFHVNP